MNEKTRTRRARNLSHTTVSFHSHIHHHHSHAIARSHPALRCFVCKAEALGSCREFRIAYSFRSIGINWCIINIKVLIQIDGDFRNRIPQNNSYKTRRRSSESDLMWKRELCCWRKNHHSRRRRPSSSSSSTSSWSFPFVVPSFSRLVSVWWIVCVCLCSGRESGNV